ncbi:MAG TPA: hypothetical protein VF502_07405 [Stellaceae bacterium]
MSAQTEATMKVPGIRPAWRRPALSWPLIVVVIAFVRPLRDGLAVLNDPDTYLHIAAGQWMIAHRALPLHDPFSHSMPGATWVPHEWLAEIVLARIYDGFGWPGLILLTTICFAITLALLTRKLLDHFEPLSTLVLVALSTVLILPHLLARPHVLAFPLVVTWSAALISARDSGRAPPLWILPVMTLWANLHGGFMFGLALAVFLGAEAVLAAVSMDQRLIALRQWGGFVALAGVAALLTPNGLDGLLLPFRVNAMPILQRSFGEWMSPNFQQFDALEIWILGIMFVGFALGLKLSAGRVLLLLALFHMALQHTRHADLVALVAPLAVAASLGPLVATRVNASPPSALRRGVAALANAAGSLGVAVAVAIILAAGGIVLLRPIERPDGPETPKTALATAMRMGLSGPVFNSETFGGYLIFNGVPTFIDGRIEMYGDAFLGRYLDAEEGKETALTGVLDQYGITWTLLMPQNHIIEVLDHLPGWQRVYADRYAVIHVRQAAPPR